MLALAIYTIGIIGIIINKKNIINTIISIEIMLLGINLLLITVSSNMDDIVGNVLSIYILTICGCESAIGLTIVILINRKYKTIDIEYINRVKCQ